MKTKQDKKKQQLEDPKKFLEYKRSKPLQLSLFDLLENEKEFSYTIEFYDFMRNLSGKSRADRRSLSLLNRA
jgi:hypothetical protein